MEKKFCNFLIKNKKETHEKVIKLSRNNDYSTVNFMDGENFSNRYKPVALDLSKQIEL